MRKFVAIHNLGCKVNAYETEGMAEKLIRAGFSVVSFDERADFYVVNTCSVTNIADRKSRQMLHRARKLNPDAVIIAVGCYVDTHGREGVCQDGVDIALPNTEKENIVEVIKAWEESHGTEEEETEEPETSASYGEIIRSSGEERHISGEGIYTRKFLKVQDGCNMFCSYCIIPYARGRIRSKGISEVLSEIASLTEKGYREFVLTGIHLSSYGLERPEDKEDLLKLIMEADRLPGVRRLRLGSLEPRIITEEFARGLKGAKSICPHFHLSLQSGSDTVLKRMNRHYTAAEYLQSVEILRSYFDDPALTTDVITGFPGETEEEFKETYDFIKRTGFYETHIFPYSRRKGTAADRMDGQLVNSVKHERLATLQALDSENRKKYEDRHIGKCAEVLFEDGNEGYTREYIRVKCPNGKIKCGEIHTGTITGRNPAEGVMELEFNEIRKIHDKNA